MQKNVPKFWKYLENNLKATAEVSRYTSFFTRPFFLPPPSLTFINFINFVRPSVCCVSVSIQLYGTYMDT